MKPTTQISIRPTPEGSFCFVVITGSQKVAESVDYPTHADVCAAVRELNAGSHVVVDTTREGKANPQNWG